MKLKFWLTALLYVSLSTLLGASGGQSLPMGALPAQSSQLASDNFPGTSLSGNWTVLTSVFSVVSGVATDNASAIGSAYWNAVSFPANQYSQGSMFVSYIYGAGVGVRIQSTTPVASPGYGYFCYWRFNDQLVHLDVSSPSGVTSLGTISEPSVTTGTVIKATAVGSTISCYLNGISVLSTTDSTWAAGHAGIFSNSSTPGNEGISNWSAGAD